MEESRKLNHVIDNIAAIRIAILTTEGSDGVLHSRPMYTLEIDDQHQLWFYTNSETLKLSDLDHHQQVNVSYADTHTHSYISICGKAYEIEDEGRKKELWDPAIEAWFPAGPDSEDIRLLVVKMDNATYWDIDSATMVTGIKFK
ncbi:MAG: pyridoxamine 5'-phosphate oxidase family protein [Candidatus Cyclobacteriaceae bacterium M2_1C_046]